MESTLSLKYGDLAGEVGHFLGYGRGADGGDVAWTGAQEAAIESCLKSGLRQFYFPPPVEGVSGSHDWSFLRPTAQVTLASGESSVKLPDDFGGFEGEVTLVSSSTAYCPVPLVNEGQVRRWHAESPSSTGTPRAAALEPLKGTGGRDRGQRFRLAVFPTADAAYTLSFCYYVLPDALTDALPHAYGGTVHAETILESCLAVAEQRLDDSAGVHTMKFRERLMASISLDRRSKPQKLGYNGDRSDWPGLDYKGRRWPNAVTVNGVEY